MDDYRASFGLDAEHDNSDHAVGRRLSMPVRVLWGETGASAAIPTLDIWSEYADNVVVRPYLCVGISCPKSVQRGA